MSLKTVSHVWHEEDFEAIREAHCVHRKGITISQAVEQYSTWSRKYEKDLCPGRYKGPMIAGKVVADYFEDDREKKKIIDIAAGTGFVAEHLRTHGFVHIDALEPSSKMLLRAKEKGLYEDYYTEYLCEVPLPIPNDTYDCAVTSGGMGEGHIPCSGIPELIRIVKPGGIICIIMREVFLRDVDEYKDRLEPLMDSLEKEGKWRQVSRVIIPNYFIVMSGIVFLYRVI
ncbi:methyltransferase-like protein 27 isoform X2 [Haliotis rufescens]|uniref:methyltransferase-like protein 27 isoform X2 n=1 Tax=Haliotis rufescens TaxID=6454 RepID=UPI00201FB3B3|nr:methyltransferase-like protein 27 isoform X2 [Haliotis rufescens]